MGGGDLNLKKSWHPHTMKNQEKVWKAEQAKTQEEKKLHDLRREIEEEKNREELTRIGRENGVLAGNSEGEKKLDWMYRSSTELINREEYLLGRKIDKSFEVLQTEEKEKEQNLVGVKQPINHVEHECVPFSIRAYKNVDNLEQVDLQRKVMEDPLMLIKQREMESRRKILENPVKLKELHRILKTDDKLRKVSKKSKKSKKKKKSNKKHRKRSKSSSPSGSSSASDDSDLDNKLAKKLKCGLLNKDDASSLGLNLTKLLDSKFQKISQELDKAAGKNKTFPNKNKSNKNEYLDTNFSSNPRKSYSSRRSKSSSRKLTDKDRRYRSVSRERVGELEKYEQGRIRFSASRNYSHKKHERSRSNSRSQGNNKIKTSRSDSKKREKRIANRSRSRSIQRKIKNRRESNSVSKEYRYTSDPNGRHRSKSSDRNRSRKSRSPVRISSGKQNSLPKEKKPSSSTAQQSSKLTDEEKQAKLKEMMSNATWREEERTEVVRKHRESYNKEEERYKAREFDKDFLNKEVKKAISCQTSVGSRLRANLNNIQRNSAAMNSNFVRK